MLIHFLLVARRRTVSRDKFVYLLVNLFNPVNILTLQAAFGAIDRSYFFVPRTNYEVQPTVFTPEFVQIGHLFLTPLSSLTHRFLIQLSDFLQTYTQCSRHDLLRLPLPL